MGIETLSTIYLLLIPPSLLVSLFVTCVDHYSTKDLEEWPDSRRSQSPGPGWHVWTAAVTFVGPQKCAEQRTHSRRIHPFQQGWKEPRTSEGSELRTHCGYNTSCVTTVHWHGSPGISCMSFLYQLSCVSLVSLMPGLLVPSVTPFLGSSSPCKGQITSVRVVMIPWGNVIRLRSWVSSTTKRPDINANVVHKSKHRLFTSCGF